MDCRHGRTCSFEDKKKGIYEEKGIIDHEELKQLIAWLVRASCD